MKRFQLLLKKLLPYILAAAVIYAVMFFGSRHDDGSIKSPLAAAFSDTAFTVTADQISETYTVANIASSISLPSTATISENYVTVNAIYESTGTTNTADAVIDKPTIIDTSDLTRGVITHTIEEGDTIQSILKKYNITGVSNDQVRWSNGMKTEELTVGNKIYLPSVPGIVYVVKEGDNYQGIAEKFGSNYDEIIARNDLENTEIRAGLVLLLPNGTLPETERPEYVAPKPRQRQNTNTNNNNNNRASSGYSYISSGAGIRKNLFMVGNYAYWRNMYNSTKDWGNPGAFGNCTWFAWYWRRANMPSNYWLPGGVLGNARSWNTTLAARGFPVGKTPAYGAVVQTATSGYGHVGVVVGVNEGVSITIQEMNFAGPNGKFNIVYQSEIDWGNALRFNYIYGR